MGKKFELLSIVIIAHLFWSCKPDPNLHRYIGVSNQSSINAYVSFCYERSNQDYLLSDLRNITDTNFKNILRHCKSVLAGEYNDSALGPPRNEEYWKYSYWEWLFYEGPYILFVYVINATADDGSIISIQELTLDRIIKVYELSEEDLEMMDWCITYSE